MRNTSLLNHENRATPLPLDGGGCACLPVGRGGGVISLNPPPHLNSPPQGGRRSFLNFSIHNLHSAIRNR
jgi:hypothetical protein